MKFTAAHFAATLLECGPHERREKVMYDMCDPASHPQGKLGRVAYYDRVYSHFLLAFQSGGTAHQNEAESLDSEWHIFWRDYITWVES